METLRHVGYRLTDAERTFLSPANINAIGKEASRALLPLHTVKFTDEVVQALLEKNWFDYKPPTNDIYSLYQIEPHTRQSQQEIVRAQTINMLVSAAQTQIATMRANNALDINIIKYTGELNPTPPIKLRNKRPQTMLFNMNY